jgi:16S rRNA (cytosine967-C5)-methyltransferase
VKESSRSLALAALRRWRLKAEFADQVVAQAFGRSSLSAVDRAFALELFYGALRNLTLLDFWIDQLRPERANPRVRDILRLGLYQIMLIETAAHAAVFETVELARPRVRPLVNAILRRALREKAALYKSAEEQRLHLQFSEPGFLVAKWTRQFGGEAALELCRWNNRPAPVYARINQLKTTAAEFLHRYPGSFLLPGNTNFASVPEPAAALERGDCYIQDPSTAIACELLRPAPGEMVLDACAAPGGKTAYLAEMMANEGTLAACDQDATRLERLRLNLVRLGVANARIVRCDWRDANSVQVAGFADHSFDKILVDAPCTNTGVMRRRIDVRWRLRPEDFSRMQRQQIAILGTVAPLLKPGGSLVYSTCSLEPEENERVVAAFVRDHPAFRLTNHEQCLPFRNTFDGAFAARLESASLHRRHAMES